MSRKKLFDPKSSEPFNISRSKIELFVRCPRCFYLDRRLGVGRPGFPAFTLNNAVDKLLKKEFDIHRKKGSTHSLMEKYGIDAIPFDHEKINEWRMNFKGVRFHYKPTNFMVFGAVDDIWIKPDGSLIVVDYKATSTASEITLDGKWKKSYKRQMEIYQWLLRHNNHKVSEIGYFVYANGKTDNEAFDKQLEFEIVLLPYKGDDSWVEDALHKAHKCLSGELPSADPDCEYCNYRKAAKQCEK
ncbi:MAG: PD-(D/E)XK nuclease family protein [Candidatus Saganbacteria bacterium]|nr:PD-(D/E)XK nuclease family protein [Candidatus Saganbacteria bacterium]